MRDFFPYSADNLTTPKPLVTSTYYNNLGELNLNPTGNPRKEMVGPGTKFPIGLKPQAAFDLNRNTKCMYYRVNCVIQVEDSYSSIESINVSGMIKRFRDSTGSMFLHKHHSVNINGQNTTNAFVIYHVDSFYDFRRFMNYREDLYWFPRFFIEFAGDSGYIASGDSDSFLSWENFEEHIPDIPIMGYPRIVGAPISTTIYEARIVQTERYDEITTNVVSAVKGTPIVISSPDYSDVYNLPSHRSGLLDVVSIKFGGSQEVTNFTKGVNVRGVTDTISVVVPQDATTGEITLKARVGTNEDIFSLAQPFSVL